MKGGRRSRVAVLLANSASLVGGAVVVRASSLLIYVLVARYRGAFEFGQLSLAMSVFAILLEIALVGVRRVIVREVAIDRATSRPAMLSSGLLTAVASLVAIAVAWVFVRVMRYGPETAFLIVLLATALWPAALTQVAESVAQAWERAQLTLAVHVPVTLLKVAGVLVALERGEPVRTIAGIILVSHLVTALLACTVMYWRAPAAPLSRVVPQVFRLARSGLPFLGINLTAALRSNAGTVLVSGFLGEVAVGLFNAAMQLTVPVRLVYENLVTSFFPTMVRRFEAGAGSLRLLTGRLIGGIGALTLPLIVIVFLLAEPILLLIYGEQAFAGAATVVMITIWVPLLDTVKGVLGQALWAARYERVAFRVGVVNLVVAILAGFALISTLGLLGAAISVAVVAIVNVAQHQRAASSTLGGSTMTPDLAYPLVAAAAMAGVWLGLTPVAYAIAIPAAFVTYGVVMFTLLLWSAGGMRGLRARYLAPWNG